MRKPEKIIPIILAAGSSPALPFPKALAPFGKQTAVEIAVRNCSFLDGALVVLGANAKQIAPHVPKSAKVVTNRRWRNGQLTSLQAALRKIPSDAAFLIYPVDHPLLQRKTLEQLVRAYRARSTSKEIVMPKHQDAYGHPVIVSSRVRPEFFAAQTAREVIYRFPRRLKIVPAKTTAIFTDFNSPETYNLCLRSFQSRRRNVRLL
jgi:CTP:molybdopterin cytidylyltransferase MocA